MIETLEPGSGAVMIINRDGTVHGSTVCVVTAVFPTFSSIVGVVVVLVVVVCVECSCSCNISFGSSVFSLANDLLPDLLRSLLRCSSSQLVQERLLV